LLGLAALDPTILAGERPPPGFSGAGPKAIVTSREGQAMVFWTTLLIIHGLLAVTLLGAITHQTVALWLPVRTKAGSFVARFRAVPGTSYVGAIIVLYLLTFVMGAWIYTQYRFTARLALEQLRFFKTVGVFEMKEHLATMGLILLPAYWAFWRRPLSEDYAAARRQVTLFLAILVWANFLIGHIANNARGFGS
jgi:hypothetical protein